MTRDEKKIFLKQYTILSSIVKQKIAELQEAEEEKEQIDGRKDSLPVQEPIAIDKIPKKIELCDKIKENLEEEITKCSNIMNLIIKTIESVEPIEGRQLLKHRYLEGKKWEQIAEITNYDERYIFKKHNKALDKVDIKRQYESMVAAGIIVDDSYQHIDLVLKGSVDKENPRTEIEVI